MPLYTQSYIVSVVTSFSNQGAFYGVPHTWRQNGKFLLAFLVHFLVCFLLFIRFSLTVFPFFWQLKIDSIFHKGKTEHGTIFIHTIDIIILYEANIHTDMCREHTLHILWQKTQDAFNYHVLVFWVNLYKSEILAYDYYEVHKKCFCI